MISEEIIMTIATVDSAMNLYPVKADHCLVYFFSDKIQLTKLDIAFITDFALITSTTTNWKIAPVFAPVTVATLNMPISDVKKMIVHPENYFTENSEFIFLPNLLSNKKLQDFPGLFLNQNIVPVIRLRKLKEELLTELQKALQNRPEHNQVFDALTINSDRIVPDVSLSNPGKEQQEESKRGTSLPVTTVPNQNLIELIYEKYINNSFQYLPPHVSQIAAEMHITVSHLQYLFKSHFGKTFYRVYLDKKMEYALLLLEKGLRASKVAKLVGYAAPIKFNKQFQKHFGVTPFQYTKNRFKDFPRRAI